MAPQPVGLKRTNTADNAMNGSKDKPKGVEGSVDVQKAKSIGALGLGAPMGAPKIAPSKDDPGAGVESGRSTNAVSKWKVATNAIVATHRYGGWCRVNVKAQFNWKLSFVFSR